jgi:adenine-specific DNA-methyltransferase
MTALRSPSGELHPIQRRYFAEDLVRLRRSDEQRRYAAPQRAAKIDANPHQIEAVIFALGRVREGGCILADEVGLGKTIEAGLVIAQLLAEGAHRVLLIAPKSLLGQWRQELFTLFGLEAIEGVAQPGGFDGDGIYLIGREAAGSENGRDAILASGRFDLCIIDEAHEVFAGIYKRFDKFGNYNEESREARTAGRVREVLIASGAPVLLLTATPIQNSLTELWGLVQYVDPLGTLLGDLPTFREVFCGLDDRQLAPGQEDELRSRLRVVIQRTLRRQAQEFLEQPFVKRHARLFDYTMSPAERSLYDDVSRYLLEAGIVAFQGSQRQLLLLGFHRRMASSTRALGASLEGVAARLRRKLATAEGKAAEADAADAQALADDLEDDDLTASKVDLQDAADASPIDDVQSTSELVREPEAVRAELLRVESFIRRAEELGQEDGKFRALLKALHFVIERGEEGQGAGKVVIFTESRVTMKYLRDRIVESQFVAPGDVTLFSGVNDSREAMAALARWRNEVPKRDGPPPSEEMAIRLALVHEFETRSRVFISTEAGAKGLNLQFCDTVVNYDLPWNPQRIEQRIGRCHRYKQRHDVTVINFLAKDNEAQQLTFEILSQKLELFGTVLDASDQVLHQSDTPGSEVLVSALGAEFEAELRRIYERSRTLDEVTAELRALREKVGEERRRFEVTHQRTASLIESHFDDSVQLVFRMRKSELPAALVELDREFERVVTAYLEAAGVPFERTTGVDGDLLRIAASPKLPSALHSGLTAAIGPSPTHTPLHLSHPLVLAAVDEARGAALPRSVVIGPATDAPEALAKHAGRSGRLRLVKVLYDGFECTARIVPIAVLAESLEVLDPIVAHAMFKGTVRDLPDGQDVGALRVAVVNDDVIADATEEVLFAIQGDVDRSEHVRFERASQQADRFLDDRLLVCQRRREDLTRRFDQAVLRRDAATSSEARTAAEQQVASAEEAVDKVNKTIGRLERREDKTFRAFHDHIHQRRYAPPRVEHLFDVEFSIS